MSRRDDAVTYWMNAAGRHPLLTPAEELHLGRLVRRWLDDPGASALAQRRGRRARDRMVAGNLRLVGTVVRREAKKYPRLVGPCEVPDMLQAGAIGLVRAAERFDPERGYKFSTLAFWWIWQATTRWVATDCRTIRLPVARAEELSKIYKATDRLVERLGRPPTRQELAAELGTDANLIDARLRAGQPCLSLDYMVANEDDQACFLDFLPAPLADDQYDHLYGLIDSLPPLQAMLIREHYGLDSCRWTDKTQLAKNFGLTTEQVRRQLRLAHGRLQGRVQLSLPTPT